jgi:hypothetical protein
VSLILRLRGWLAVVGVVVASIGLTGCMTVKSYVDPTLPVLAQEQLPKIQKPQPATVLFEFRTKGNANARATNSIRPKVMAAVADSRMFGTLSEAAGSADSGLLRVVIDDQADMGNAAAKGFGTGLTFGLAGSLVTDVYVCTASYTIGGKTVETTVQHALHSTIGNHGAPQGMTAVKPQEAVDQIVHQLVWHALQQLDQEHAFGT